jgi:hypothetical protein
MKTSWATSRVNCLYETDVSRTVLVMVIKVIGHHQNHDDDDDDERDGPRNVGFI